MPIVLLVLALIVTAVFLAMTLCVILATMAVTRSRRGAQGVELAADYRLAPPGA